MNVLFEERPSLAWLPHRHCHPGCGKEPERPVPADDRGPGGETRRLGRRRRHRLRAVARQRRQGLCAGGDVRKLVDACREQPGEVPALARRFFADEYRLDYRIPLPETLHLLGPRLCNGRRHGADAGCRDSHRHPVQPPGDAGDRHRPVPGRRRQLVPRPPARQARPVPRPERGADERPRRSRPRPGRPLPSRRPAGRPARRPGADELERVAPGATSQPASRLEHEARGELPEAQLLPRRPRLDALLDQPGPGERLAGRWWRCATTPTRCLRVARRPWPRAAR